MEGTVVEIREASARLPERQREALELRDRDGRSYEEIAAALGMSPGAVAQLIAHARINLYDELRGTALASVAPSPECERALPLIAMREDGELEPSSDDAGWLDSRLAGCERCALAVEQMGEAEAAYRAQEPERPGGDADRTDGQAARIRRPGAGRPPEPAGIPVATPTRRSRRTLLAACLAGLLLLGGVAAVLAATDRSTAPVESVVTPAAEQSAGRGETTARPAGKSENGARGDHEKQVAKRSGVGGEGAADSAAGAAESPTSLPVTPPAEGGGGAASGNDAGSGGNRSSGKAAVEPTRQTSSSKPKSPPASTSAPPSTTTATAPPPESPPPAEAEVDEPGHRGEPPGKAVGHQPH